MIFRRLDRPRAALRFNEFDPRKPPACAELSPQWRALRHQLLTAIDLNENDAGVVLDRKAGVGLYRVFSPEKLSLSSAADDLFWRFLSLDVVPDIVFRRAGPDPVWFYGGKWRLWLKRIWWWVHLCWQGDEESTRLVLSQMTTDTIAQLVERPGIGFRVSLTRQIAATFRDRKVSQDEFRKIMRLNTALLVATEPSCATDGELGYVKQLLATVSKMAPAGGGIDS